MIPTRSTLYSFVIFLFGILSPNLSSQSGWFQIHPYSNGQSVTKNILRSVWFTNELKGFAVGYDGTVLSTTDGGAIWKRNDLGLVKAHLTTVAFTNDHFGYISGWDGILLKTTNGGLNWFAINLPSYFNIESINFISADTGWIAGWVLKETEPTIDGGFIFGTTDGGNSWATDKQNIDTTFAPPYTLWWQHIHFPSKKVGYAVDFFRRFGKTTDGGMSWSVVRLPVGGGLLDVFFHNEMNGVIAGEASTIMITTDGGISWTKAVTPQSALVNSIFFTNDSIGYACGTYLWKTTDAGYHWFEQYKPNPDQISLRDIFFVNKNVGWIVGDSGRIIKTENGGISSYHIPPELPNQFIIESIYPNPVNSNQRVLINYQLPKREYVEMRLYDLFGREIKIILNEIKDAGTHQIQISQPLNTGIYFLKLVSQKTHTYRKFVVMK